MTTKKSKTEIPWQDEARARVENAPSFVRAGILKLTEIRAGERGRNIITSDFLTEIRNESMLRVAKVIKAFGFEELSMESFDIAKQKMKKNARKVEVISEIENYLESRTEKKDEIIEKFKKYLDMVPESGLPWTEEALQRIERVPAFVRKMVESTIEEAARKRKDKVITKEVVAAALSNLGPDAAATMEMPSIPEFTPTEKHSVSAEISTTLPWLPEAGARLKSIPIDFVRRRIIKRVEAYAQKNGHQQVTLEVYEIGKGSA